MMIESTAKLNFTHPCTFCGGDMSVINGERVQHVCKIPDVGGQKGRACSNPECLLPYAHNGPCA